jgi:20S proteasome alpha/beta subunit
LEEQVDNFCYSLVEDISITEAKNYKRFYNDDIPARVFADRLAQYVQAYTLKSYVRPYGCSVIIGAYDRSGPQLYMIEPSGVCYVRLFLFHLMLTDWCSYSCAL